MTLPKEPDKRLNPLTVELVRIYEAHHGTKYNHSGGKDAMALKGLLAKYEPEIIASVWARGVTSSGFEQVYNFAQLSGKWSQLVAVKNDAKNSHVYKEEHPSAVDRAHPKASPFGACSVCGRGSWMMLHVPPSATGGELLPFCASEDPNHLEMQKRGEFWP